MIKSGNMVFNYCRPKKVLFVINSFWVFHHSIVQIRVVQVKIRDVVSTAVAFLHTVDQISSVHIYRLY